MFQYQLKALVSAGSVSVTALMPTNGPYYHNSFSSSLSGTYMTLNTGIGENVQNAKKKVLWTSKKFKVSLKFKYSENASKF